MIGEALRLPALRGNNINIGIAVIGGGEGDPFAVGRKFGVELVAGAGSEPAGGAPFAWGSPEIAGVGEDDFVFGNVGVAEKARGAGRNLVSGRGLAVRRGVDAEQHGEKDCEREKQTGVFSSHCAFSDLKGFSVWSARRESASGVAQALYWTKSLEESLRFLPGACVLLGRQRFERGLLLMALSGYASVYNMNTYFQLVWKTCGCSCRGT